MFSLSHCQEGGTFPYFRVIYSSIQHLPNATIGMKNMLGFCEISEIALVRSGVQPFWQACSMQCILTPAFNTSSHLSFTLVVCTQVTQESFSLCPILTASPSVFDREPLQSLFTAYLHLATAVNVIQALALSTILLLKSGVCSSVTCVRKPCPLMDGIMNILFCCWSFLFVLWMPCLTLLFLFLWCVFVSFVWA